ncbi:MULTISPECIES: Crp/Fnr family transcriptional regulator [unclassified Flavobacterium]|jgi:CRP-like cAMP-binding protein|uniref:Crp/Fnr family transcriptional regulator n=1 Tax=unclassified Flavobacterium TaxID=196869 RepID=UPI00057EAD3C|nr:MULTISPECIES: Crp/Fnr family transcriptional regulator [unclassified Flavobacterium]KIA97187.1 cAMP-binding protein [Flavobacterium sp. KMS]MEA9412741.1 Crp/Fnr family transcriptional regulator [Flavobacterium sp. PL02]OUL63872.1 cAMP-binding protein [Flavobacterium sp. AJR]
MTELIAFINTLQELDFETEQAIKKCFVKETYAKNEFIVEEGKICSKISYIKSGLVRRFYLDDGEEITKWIYTNDQFVTSLSSFFEQKPSFEIFQACEETILYSLSYTDEQLLLEYPLFAKFHIKLLRLYLSKLNEFHHSYKLMSAQEKYMYLLHSFPSIIKKAKLKHIASLINVSPETLSRIRASIN